MRILSAVTLGRCRCALYYAERSIESEMAYGTRATPSQFDDDFRFSSNLYTLNLTIS